MANQINLDLLWAELGGKTDPTDNKWETGWVAEIPTYQNFNYVLHANASNTLHLAENGAFQWQTEINYEVGAIVREDDSEWFCITAHDGQQPSADSTNSYWVNGKVIGRTPTTPTTQKHGLYVADVNDRTLTSWEGNDVTIENTNALVALNTSGAGVGNLVFGNVNGSLVVVDVGNTVIPDGRSILVTEPNVNRIFHEGHPPEQSQVSGTIPDAPSNGTLYARQSTNWVKVTTTDVTDLPPPASQGAGGGWYNLSDGQLYLDINDGDSSQWVLANPPVIPEVNAGGVVYDDTDTGLGDDVKEAIDNLHKAGRKNLLINGGFDVWQRGDSFTNLTTNDYTADRWNCISRATGTDTVVTQEDFSYGQTLVSGNPKHFMKYTMAGSGAVSTSYMFMQRVEEPTKFSGKTLTLSFWMKADTPDTIKLVARPFWGTGGVGDTPTKELGTVNPTTSWEKYTFTYTSDVLSPTTVAEDAYYQLRFEATSIGQVGEFDIAQVQLEEGSVATPFEDRHIGEELALCQRYYQRFGGESNKTIGFVGSMSTATTADIYGVFPVPMRDIPTLTALNMGVSTATGSLVTFTELYSFGATNHSFRVLGNTTSVPTGTFIFARVFSGGDGYIAFDAEL